MLSWKLFFLLLIILPLKLQSRPSGQKKVDPGYMCSICGLQGAWRGDRKRHERTHTQERPHQCLYCPMKFVQSYDKTLHEHRHTEEEKEIGLAARSLLFYLASFKKNLDKIGP